MATKEVTSKKMPPKESVENPQSNSPNDKIQKEIGGRDGPDPARYGDWENKGIASDF